MVLPGHAVYFAELTGTTGLGLRNALLNILGSFLVLLVAFRAVALLADEKYGKMITLMLGGAVVAGFCFFPDQAIALLKALWITTFGGG